MHNALSGLKEAWYKIDGLYDLYAKSKGLNFASILILQLLYEADQVYTQKDICEKLNLPKQFVNSIIKSFWEQGFVELIEATDRRNKEINLTVFGSEYAFSVLKPLEDVENLVWDSFSPEEIALLTPLLDRYIEFFEVALKKSSKNT
jgi:DNA-binding MarR family transcriptional regulator